MIPDEQMIVNIVTAHSRQYAMSKFEVEFLVETIAKELDFTDWKILKAEALARLKPNAQ